MIIELRKKSQITLPKEIANSDKLVYLYDLDVILNGVELIEVTNNEQI